MKKEHYIYLGIALSGVALVAFIYHHKKIKAPATDLTKPVVNQDGSKAVIVKKFGSDPAKVVNANGDIIYTTDKTTMYDENEKIIGIMNAGLFCDSQGIPFAAPDGSYVTDITDESSENWNGHTRTYQSPNQTTYDFG